MNICFSRQQVTTENITSKFFFFLSKLWLVIGRDYSAAPRTSPTSAHKQLALCQGLFLWHAPGLGYTRWQCRLMNWCRNQYLKALHVLKTSWKGNLGCSSRQRWGRRRWGCQVQQSPLKSVTLGRRARSSLQPPFLIPKSELTWMEWIGSLESYSLTLETK